MNNYFEDAVNKTLELEGFLSNDKNDSGGLTKYGISQKAYPNEDIKNLTLEKAKFLYKRDYWDANKCGDILDKAIAMQIFDIAVNGGLVVVQRAINAMLPKGITIKEDGVIGNATLTKINSLDAKTLNNNIMRYRNRRYAKICVDNPSQLDFAIGWADRCCKFAY